MVRREIKRLIVSHEISLKRKGLIVLKLKFSLAKGERCGTFKMEKYLAVIKVLENGDLITQKQIMEEADLKLESQKDVLEFLLNAQLIVEKKIGNKKLYAITEKGERLYNYFRLNDDSEIFGGTNITRID